jgi:hypothetical protein
VVDKLWLDGEPLASLMLFLFLTGLSMALYVMWSVATQAIIIEKVGAIEGLARSARLTEGRRWAILGLTMIVVVTGFALFAGLSMLTGASSAEVSSNRPATLAGIAGHVLSALSSAYFAVQTTVLYYYLRREKEGAESGDIARIFD